MKRLMMTKGAKAGAALILTLCILLFAGSMAGTVYLYSDGDASAQKKLKYYETELCQYQVADKALQYLGYYYYNSDAGKKETADAKAAQEAERAAEMKKRAASEAAAAQESLYPAGMKKYLFGKYLSEIPKWNNMDEKAYRIQADDYFYRVETTEDGKKRFINEDGSTAFMLYQSGQYIDGSQGKEKYIGYIPGDEVDRYAIWSQSNEYLDHNKGANWVLLDPTNGTLYFTENREVVYVSGEAGIEEEQQGIQKEIPLTSTVFVDEGRLEEDHLNYAEYIAQTSDSSDFVNMNLHIEIFSDSKASADGEASIPRILTDGKLENGLDTEFLKFSEKIGITSISGKEGKTDVSSLGNKVSENYSYSGDGDYSVTIRYDNGLSAVCTIVDPMKNLDFFLAGKLLHNIAAPLGAWIILLDVILALLSIALFVFLIAAAGRKPVELRNTEANETVENGNTKNSAADSHSIYSCDVKRLAGGTEVTEDIPEDGESALSDKASRRAERAEMRRWNRARRLQEKKERWAAKGYQIIESVLDRIPFDLFLIIFFTLLGCVIAIDAAVAEYMVMTPGSLSASQTGPLLCAAVAAAIAGIFLCIVFSMSCSVRFKVGGWWRNSLIYRLAIWLKRVLGKVGVKALRPLWKCVKDAVRSIAIQWKLVLGFAVIVLVNLITGNQMVWHGSGMFLIFGMLFDIIAFFVILRIGMMLRRLQKGGRKLADGDLDAKVDTSAMRGEFREHGENLNNISRGMAIAVEQQMKSERMKSELITNVSHDIKTPLTSIVNYVDLLSKENLEGKAGEYTEVLVRQSARLKKLTEDLVEASKASTGNINVNLQDINVCETVNQAVGEYAERLEASSLSVVTDFPEWPVIAEADGRLLWRILDNLLSNVCKYSMPNTRVYIAVTQISAGERSGSAGWRIQSMDGGIDNRSGQYTSQTYGEDPYGNSGKKRRFHAGRLLHRVGRREEGQDFKPFRRPEGQDVFRTYSGLEGRISIAVKNISRERLNVAADELMERFVRGDSSRTTEGSGLGLNIARSLTELQGGKFDISIDGDLFKAEIVLKSRQR